jgi:two-component system cell cycle sensor histidine kinase/response regulator CckA
MSGRRVVEPAYVEALTAYIADRSEAALRDAYELGRRAVEQGLGILDMVHIHGTAVARVLGDSPQGPEVSHLELIRSTSAFLVESLSPFEMTHRGFRDAHQVLKQSEARYRSLVENAPLGLARCDLAGRLLSANPALVELLGCESQETLLTGVEVVGGLAESVELLLHATAELPVVESEWRRGDGAPIVVRVTGRPIMGPQGMPEALEIMCEDITVRRRLEDQLRQAQKMEAIARLAGGVAHDFNNFITGILLSTHILSRGLDADAPSRKQVSDIEYAANRASLLTRQLLTFGRRQPMSMRVVDVNRVISGMTKLLEPLLGAEVELRLDLHPETCPIHVDPAQLEQVLMNMAINARDAIPDKGRITIRVAAEAIPAERADSLGVDPGAYVIVRVEDTGEGMDAQTQAKVFEPFFTTKSSGKGTGLGLATSYGIVTHAGGAIAVTSSPGEGTTMAIYLPVATEALSPTPLDGDSPPPTRGTETILLAEDDRTVRTAAEHALREMGYAVVSAGSGDEAIAIAERGEKPLDLVVTDVVMPGAGGREVAARVQALYPKARVLFMSGYATDDTAGRGISIEEVSFLQKPFTPEILLTKVRAVLDAGSVPH